MKTQLISIKEADEFTTRILAPVEVRGVWDELEAFITLGLSKSRHEIGTEHVHQALLLGAMTVFIGVRNSAIEIAMVVEIVEYPNFKVANIVSMGGRNLRDAVRFWPAFETWALALGAVEIHGAAHPSLSRLYRRLKLPLVPIYEVVCCDLRRRLQ